MRTVVIVNNDRLAEVEDEALKMAINEHYPTSDWQRWYGPYHVVELTHADNVSLLKFNTLCATRLASGYWNQKDLDISLVREAADKLGYRLVRKPSNS